MQTLSAIRCWIYPELRRRWLALSVLGLLVALAGGTVMAATAGARRGASALERLRIDTRPATGVVLANTPNFDWDVIRALPEVETVTTFLTRYSFFFDGVSHEIGVGGHSLDTSLHGAFAPTDDAVLRTIEKPVVVSGRLFDSSRDDEAVVTPRFVDQTGKGIGDVLGLTLPSPADIRAGLDATSPALSGPRIRMHIVGIVRSPWFADSVDSKGSVIMSPGLVGQHPENTVGDAASENNPAWVNALVRLRHGERDLPRFRASLIRVTKRADIQLWNLPQQVRTQQHEIAFEARCLLAFGAAVLLAAMFVLGQALARYTGNTIVELDGLRGPGLTRGQQALLASAAPVGAVTLGCLVGGVAAAVASRWFPIGTATYVEPHPGSSVDWVVIGPGLALLIIALTASAGLGAWRAARRPTESTTGRRSGAAVLAFRAGLPISIGIGARFALERGSGRAAHAVRPTLVGAVAGVAGIVAALTFSAGVNDAADRPERYGQTFQLGGFFGQSGLDYFPAARVAALVSRQPGVTAVGNLREAVATGAGGASSVSLFSMAATARQLDVVVTSGRMPAAPDEVLLAPRTLGPLHAGLGSPVSLRGDRGLTTYRVTGIGFIPQGGANQVYADGGWLSPAGFGRLFRTFRFHFLAVAIGRGADPDAVGQRVAAAVNDALRIPKEEGFSLNSAASPVEILELRQVRALPILLGAFLALLAIAAIGNGLSTGVRRRSSELAVLRALGMTPRQCRWAVTVQATVTAAVGLAFGIPLGVALGRSVWRAVADYTPLQYISPAVWPILILCVPATLLLANVLAAQPGRRAARLHVTQALRVE